MTTPRPPAPLPRSARAMLAAYRDAHELPDAARDRIWSVVGAEDAPAPAFDPLEDEARAAEPTDAPPSHVRWLGWGVAALAAAAVLVLAWQLGGTLAERRHASRTPDAAVMQGGGGSTQGHASPGGEGHAGARRAATSTTTSPGSPTQPIVPPNPSGSVAEPDVLDPSGSTVPTPKPEAPGSGSATSSKPRPQADPAPALGSLAAERELVARAWRALALGETTQALDAVAEHARRFPAGLLAPERAAIETIARCRRGDADGPRRATAFHHAHPRSPLAERVDEACVVASKESTTP